MGKHNELSEEVKYEKMKLHIKYVLGIALTSTSLTIVAACFTKNKFVNEVSFASTVASIILSVIAIIMTIVGENKSENTKDKLINLSEDLEGIVQKIEKTTSEFENAVKLNSKIKTIIENKFNGVSADADTTKEEKADKPIDKSYIVLFDEAINSIDKSTVKDLCITLLYIKIRLVQGERSIPYELYISEDKIIGLNIKNDMLAWNISLIFWKELWRNEELYNHIYEYSKNRYTIEIQNLENWVKMKNEIIKQNQNSQQL
ncbi:hypothetical protein [Clostridium sp. YIM B02500]|uniref:hypothetical protein n=1 Tax=Clostridium sp. YIM B02500 TaxID=2910681 RepID=UPI001EEF6E66|nr:hypothetical protein [Clostridium sp. YIM B02500]